MTDRYDQLSDRARWFLNNFDEIDLADICASHEASNQKRQEALDRVQALIVEHPVAVGTHLLEAVLDQQPTAHNAGPSVRECADNDRRWPLEKAGE